MLIVNNSFHMIQLRWSFEMNNVYCCHAAIGWRISHMAATCWGFWGRRIWPNWSVSWVFQPKQNRSPIRAPFAGGGPWNQEKSYHEIPKDPKAQILGTPRTVEISKPCRRFRSPTLQVTVSTADQEQQQEQERFRTCEGMSCQRWSSYIQFFYPIYPMVMVFQCFDR